MGHSSLLGTDHAAQEPARRDTTLMGPGDSSDSGADLMGLADRDEADPSLPVDVALDEAHLHAALAPEVARGSAVDSAGTGERRSAGSDAGLREAADIGVDHVFTPGRGRRDKPEDEDEDLAFVDEALAGDPLEDEDESEDFDEDLEDELDDDLARQRKQGAPETHPDREPGLGETPRSAAAALEPIPAGLEDDDDDGRPDSDRGELPPARQYQAAHARRFTEPDVLHAPPPLPGQRPNPEPDRPEPTVPDAPEEDPPTEDEDHSPGRTAAGP